MAVCLQHLCALLEPLLLWGTILSMFLSHLDCILPSEPLIEFLLGSGSWWTLHQLQQFCIDYFFSHYMLLSLTASTTSREPISTRSNVIFSSGYPNSLG